MSQNGRRKIASIESILEERPPYALPADRVAVALETNVNTGLTEGEVLRRLQQFGPNLMREEPEPSFWQLLAQQFTSFLVLLLIAAAIISVLVGEYLDAVVIAAVVILNATIGVIQEQKAGQALRALKKIAAGRARVVRDGRVIEILSQNLVPGDIVLLETGNYVPADVRLIEAVNLEINEAPLTGESVPTQKNASTVLDPATTLGDVTNSAFLGTVVTRGRGKGIVTATGMLTEIGEIAELLQRFEAQVTPLQRNLARLGQVLGYAVIGIAIIVAIAGILQGRPVLETFLVSVSLAVAAIPESLPAVVTIVLAIGLQRMVRRHALIRRLPAVETLGAATVIASDKTGTLTKGEMTVVRLYAAGREVEVTGEGYRPEGSFREDGMIIQPASDPALRLLLLGAVLANDAIIEPSGRSDGRETWRVIGDPTEGALLVAGAKAGLWREELEKSFPREREAPFGSDRKLMSTIHPSAEGQGKVIFVKGAPDVVLSRSTRVQTAEGVREIGPNDKAAIQAVNDRFAARALRVLGVAYRLLSDDEARREPESLERDLTFVGLIGMLDPPRPEVRKAVAVARRAGIRPVMVTGDYKRTALAVAESLDLARPESLALSGEELRRLSDEELDRIVDRVDVYARVSPQDKVRVVEALRRSNQIVAVTGDGVNDAPALKRADIGVAMGIAGTDVAKEAAAMVLTDDNFASIVAAIEEGRIIYANIRKFVGYLLSANLGEVIVIFVGILAGLPLVLQPIQILWVNLVTDSFPALALGLEEAEPGIMEEPPRPPQEGIIVGFLRYWLVFQGLLDATVTLTAFLIGLSLFPGQIAGAQSMAFATLVTTELLRAYSARSLRRPVVSLGILSNRFMIGATVLSFLLLLLVLYLPPLQPAFNTVPLGLNEWLLIIPLALIPFLGSELFKVGYLLLSRRTPSS